MSVFASPIYSTELLFSQEISGVETTPHTKVSVYDYNGRIAAPFPRKIYRPQINVAYSNKADGMDLDNSGNGSSVDVLQAAACKDLWEILNKSYLVPQSFLGCSAGPNKVDIRSLAAPLERKTNSCNGDGFQRRVVAKAGVDQQRQNAEDYNDSSVNNIPVENQRNPFPPSPIVRTHNPLPLDSCFAPRACSNLLQPARKASSTMFKPRSRQNSTCRFKHPNNHIVPSSLSNVPGNDNLSFKALHGPVPSAATLLTNIHRHCAWKSLTHTLRSCVSTSTIKRPDNRGDNLRPRSLSVGCHPWQVLGVAC